MKTRYSLYCIVAILSIGACTNLDEEIYSSIPKEDFFSSADRVSLYASRAYAALQDWGTEQSIWTLNLQLADEIIVPVNSSGEWKDTRYSELQKHRVPAANKLNLKGWDFCFNGVAACNDVLHEIGKSKDDFLGKDMVIAEMKVLRAFFYMWAIDGWGNVPFSISKEETGYPERKTRKEVFDFIEKEITDNLPSLAVHSQAMYGRITQAVANAMLAKLYLNAEVWTGTAMWDKAEAACKAVTGVQLETDYKTNFQVNNEVSREAIFAIPYSTVYTTSDHNAFVIFVMTLPNSITKSLGITGSMWDGFVGSPEFIDSYDDADTRKASTWIYGDQVDNGGNKFFLDYHMPESAYSEGRTATQGAPIGKWEYQRDGNIHDDQTSMDNDFILLRYADVILMQAEAQLRKGASVSTDVLDKINAIRSRAGLEDLTAPTLEDIYNERCHELALEGWKRQDMIRFGKYLEAWWNKPATTDTDLLLPIPTTVLAANPNLTQNPGY